MRGHATKLVDLAGMDTPLYLARVPAENLLTVQRAHYKMGTGGRLVIGVGSEHLQISDVDCLTRRRVPRDGKNWKVTRMSGCDAAGLLRDPNLPVTRGGRWVGAWSVPPEEPAEFVISTTFANLAEIDLFCEMFGRDPALLHGSHELDPAELPELVRQLEYWSVEHNGAASSGIDAAEPRGLAFRDER
jgi:hypothetical protein